MLDVARRAKGSTVGGVEFNPAPRGIAWGVPGLVGALTFPTPRGTGTSWTVFAYFTRGPTALGSLVTTVGGSANVDLRIRATQTPRVSLAGVPLTGSTNIFSGVTGVLAATATPTEVILYWNGAVEISSTSMGGPWRLSDSSAIELLGNTTHFDGSLYMAGWIDRALTPGEIAFLSAYPLRQLAPQYRRILAVGASSPYPTLSAATAFNITATTAQPRVTITI